MTTHAIHSRRSLTSHPDNANTGSEPKAELSPAQVACASQGRYQLCYYSRQHRPNRYAMGSLNMPGGRQNVAHSAREQYNNTPSVPRWEGGGGGSQKTYDIQENSHHPDQPLAPPLHPPPPAQEMKRRRRTTRTERSIFRRPIYSLPYDSRVVPLATYLQHIFHMHSKTERPQMVDKTPLPYY